MTYIKAVFIDLDGTLVNDGKIADIDRLAVEEAISRGIPVIPATTRMRFSAYRLLAGLSVTDAPLICLNGAMVLGPGWDDVNELDPWMINEFHMATARKISEYADEMGYEITTIYGERKYWKRRRDLPVISKYENPVAFVIDSNVQALEWGNPISYMMHTENNGAEGLDDMERFVDSKFKEHTCVHRHHRYGELKALTIYPEGTSKLRGTEMVCERMGISMRDVLAIGDDEVDVEMLKAAGTGVAMENSPDHVKATADNAIPSCREGGVAYALREYVLKDSKLFN